jgi:hypothetical protein
MAAAVSNGFMGRNFVCAGAEVVPVDLEVKCQEKALTHRTQGTTEELREASPICLEFPELGLARKSWEKLRTRPAAVLAKAIL